MDIIVSAKEYLNYFESIYLNFAIFLAVFFVFSYLLGPIIFSILRLFASRTKSDIDDKIFEIVKKPFNPSLFLLLLLVYIPFSGLDDLYISYLKAIVESILILIWVRPLSKISSLLLWAASESKRSFIKKETLPLFKNMALLLIWSFALYFLFLSWGISLTAWLASAGIVGIAIGFAAKDTLANLISGIFILADAPYKVGDIIVLDSGEKGEVIHVGLRSTRIKTFDGVEITVPNAQMGNSKIVNETGTHVEKKVRLRVPVGISYEDDIEKAEKILLQIAKEFDKVCEHPAPQVRFTLFGPSSLDLELRVWLQEPTDKGKALDYINRRILEEFRKAGIEIPYNKMDIYIKEHEK